MIEAAADAGAAGGAQARAGGFTWEWGLMPNAADGSAPGARQILQHWFVRFNPLYFFSALCVLAGVYLITRAAAQFEADAFAQAQFALFAVIQAYELLLIAGCSFLARRARALRPAVLLALAEAVFLFDCTFRLESVAHLGPAGAWLVAGWAGLAVIKATLLAAALRLRVPRAVYAILLAAAAGVAALVFGVSATGMNESLLLQLAGWYGATLLAAIAVLRPAIETPLARSAWALTVLQRASRATFWILTAFYLYHLWSYLLFVSDAPLRAAIGQAGAVALYLALTRRSEAIGWWCGIVVVAAAFPVPPAASCAAFLAAAGFAYRAWRGDTTRFAVGTALAVYAALWLFGWSGARGWPDLPPALSWPNLALVLALVLIGWRLREPLAWVALVLIALAGAYHARRIWLPSTELGLGILLLAAGFVALLAGIAVNWRLRGNGPAAGSAASVCPPPPD